MPEGAVIEGAAIEVLLQANAARPTGAFASASSVEALRTEVKQNLADPKDFMLIDFWRSGLDQDLGAHWSPIAAYDSASDRVLVLDVARMRYPPYWAKLDALYAAMNTTDPESGKSRGWVSVTKGEGAPARIQTPKMSHRLALLGGAGFLGVFGLGALVGWLLTRWRIKRRVAV